MAKQSAVIKLRKRLTEKLLMIEALVNMCARLRRERDDARRALAEGEENWRLERDFLMGEMG